jgi:hypothetical protein
MWDEILKHLGDFSSAVISGVDRLGYPVSVRCKPEPDDSAQVLRVQLPGSAGIEAGPASLLCHRHDEKLWDLKSFLVRGSLEQDASGWVLRPSAFVPATGIGGWVALVRFIRDGKRTSSRYLKKRGWPRPRIPWDEIQATWAEIKK